MDNLESQISPSLHIQMNFNIDAPKKWRSCNNSPNTNFELPSSGFPWGESKQADLTPTLRPNIELPDIFNHKKIKALEEIGLFSEFAPSKPLLNYSESDDKHRRSTINISDFMMSNNKRTILKNAGGLDAYLNKKKEFQKELILRDSNLKQFFHHSEKKPKFFATPPIASRYLPNCKESKDNNSQGTKQVLDIDSIIEKCNLAMKIGPPKMLPKSNSPRILESDSGKSLKKRKILARIK